MKLKVFLMSLFFGVIAYAGPHSSECIKSMVDMLKQGKYDAAFEAVLDNSPFIKSNVNTDNLKMQFTSFFKNIETQYGKPFGFEILGTKTVGTLERTGFLIHCEKNAWVMEVFEYNNTNAKKQYVTDFRILKEEDAFTRYGL